MASPAEWPWQLFTFLSLIPLSQKWRKQYLYLRVLVTMKEHVSKNRNTNMVKYSTVSKRSEQHQYMSTWVDDQNQKLEKKKS